MFDSARVKLTVWYVSMMFVVTAFFSLIVFGILTREIDRYVSSQRFRIERRMSNMRLPSYGDNYSQLQVPTFVLDDDLVDETKKRIALALGVVNVTILSVSGMIAYFLAGKTLSPISEMLDRQRMFVGDASHDIRTPLTAIKSVVEVAIRDKNISTKATREVLDKINGQVSNLTKLTDSLLELSAFDAAMGTSDCEVLDLSQSVRMVVRDLKNLADKKNISIVTDLTDGSWVLFKISDMSRLITILTENALKYSHRDSSIGLRIVRDGHKTILTVWDEGIGIATKDLEKIFERFYRVDKSRQDENGDKGHGLGLAIAREIARQYKAKITVKSKLGKGSEFVVAFPSYKPQI
jgi:signal transduction histidine kinase